MSKPNVRRAVQAESKAKSAPQSCEELVAAIHELLRPQLEIWSLVEAVAGGLAMGNGDPLPAELRKSHLISGLNPIFRSMEERERVEKNLREIYRKLLTAVR